MLPSAEVHVYGIISETTADHSHMHDGVLYMYMYVPPLPDVEVEISDVVDVSVIFTHCLLEAYTQSN